MDRGVGQQVEIRGIFCGLGAALMSELSFSKKSET